MQVLVKIDVNHLLQKRFEGEKLLKKLHFFLAYMYYFLFHSFLYVKVNTAQ